MAIMAMVLTACGGQQPTNTQVRDAWVSFAGTQFGAQKACGLNLKCQAVAPVCVPAAVAAVAIQGEIDQACYEGGLSLVK